LWTPLLAIGVAALAVEIPFLFFGTPSGHDVEFHLYSWLEVLAQWKHGILYPRWAMMAHFGYGEPRFVFYPPASWTLGAVLAAVFPWRFVSTIYIWLTLLAAGASMFVLARRWLDRRDAVFAAVLYAVNPYHLVIVYWRSAFAELLASCLLPLLLLVVLKAADEGWRALAPMAAVLAAAWLTNAPAAVMIHYSLALLLLLLVWQQRSRRLALVGAAALGLGALLTAFYLLPAIYEQRWVDIAQAISPGSRPADNFLFVHTSDPDHDAFNHLISSVAMLEMVATFGAAWTARSWRAAKPAIWRALLAWAAACSVLMFSATLVLWRFLPKLQFMQFPWRWLLCLSFILALMVTAGLRRWWMRGVFCAVTMLVIVGAWHRIQAPWWDNRADLKEMSDNMLDRIGYEGTDEYTPAGADPSAASKDAPNLAVEGSALGVIQVLAWNAESRSFTADMTAPDQLALRLFAYPAWRMEVNGQVVPIQTRETTGQILVPVEAGMNRVQITFVRTWDRSAGGWISVIALLSIVVWTQALSRRPETSALRQQTLYLSGTEV
jgi:6-pyruvoyl-tetrahydropterin synthase related domain